MTNLAQKKPTDDPADPIVQQSMLTPLTLTVALLVASLAYMVFDEFYIKQKWRHHYQPKYLEVAHDYWVVKQKESEQRAWLGEKLVAKLDAIDRRYEGSIRSAQDSAKEIIDEAREDYKGLEDSAAYVNWENELIKKLKAVSPPAPDKIEDEEERDAAKAALDEIKELDKEILAYLASTYLTKDEAKLSDSEKVALLKTKLPAAERLAMDAAGWPDGKDIGAYEADTKAFLGRVAAVKGIEYRMAVRQKDYDDIDGLVTDPKGLRNERAMYLAELYLYDSGRDKSIIDTEPFLKREERVLRRAPVQQKLRDEINALNNERIAFEDPRVNQRKNVTRLTAELDAIRNRIAGLNTQSVDIQQRFVQNQGANNIVDRCETCHYGTDKAGMDRGELWRVSGVFVAADFMDKHGETDFFAELNEDEKLRAASELDGKAHENLDGVEWPKFKDLADIAGAFDFSYDKATDDEGLSAFERRYGKGKKLDARAKGGYALMALARAEHFLRGDMGQLGQVSDDPAKILNNEEFVKKATERRFRVLFRYASRTFRSFVQKNLLMFASHPETHGLLDVHKPSDFGCTTCHEGQGRHISGDGMVSAENKAHGYYKHSLWQLFKDGYYEAGCQSCHNKEIEIEGAPQLQAARDLFMRNGCWGCHKYEGFEPQADERMQVGKNLGDLRQRELTSLTALDKAQRRKNELEAAIGAGTADARAEREFSELPAQIAARNYELYELRRQIETAENRLHELETETKHVAPNLAQLAAKIEDKGWIARWVRYPKGFRPSTKMPHFFYGPFSHAVDEEGNVEEDEFGNHVLNAENVQALKLITAYVWQASRWSLERGNIATPGGGNSYGVPVGDGEAIKRGKDLFDSRGCQGCHTATPDIALGKDGKTPIPVGKYLTPEGKPTMDVHEAGRDKNGLLLHNEASYSWAANLSREGEKNNPDYLVEWILQPRSKDPHSVMPSLWSAAVDFPLSAANVQALEARIKAAFEKGGVADFTKTDFYARPETSFTPAELKLSGPEVAALRHDLTVAKSIREAKLVVAYLKSLVHADKDKLNAPQHDIFKRYAGGNDPYAFMESDGRVDETIIKDIELLPNGQKDAEATDAEPKTHMLKGYGEFKKWMDEMANARAELDMARGNAAKTLAQGGNVAAFADEIVAATARIRHARRMLEDTTFAGFGKKFVSYYGCASCHSIPGMEDEGKIGTELTYEGSKLIERLDFGLHHERPQPEDPKAAGQPEFAPLMTRAGGRTLGGRGFELPALFKRDFISHKHDYDTKLVWFTGKVYSPRQYDKGKRRSNWFERLRMPLFELDDEESRLIGMFIAGSRESKLPPEKFMYQLKGDAKVKADGWWLLRKYNCVGCHDIGRHEAHIRRTELFMAGENSTLNTPPKLHDAGLRLNPSWAVAWLQHPHMVRHMQLAGDNSGLDLGLRMPNFGLTESEARTIVAFLSIYAKTPVAYSTPPKITLSQQEQDFAKAVIASNNCAQCHDYREDVDGYRVPGGKAPNLGWAQNRVRYQWVHGWLTDPDLIQPQARMFRFFRPTPEGRAIFNDNPATGGNADYGKILNLEGTERWPANAMPRDPAAVLRDYVLFYYPKTRKEQDDLQELTRRITDAKQKVR